MALSCAFVRHFEVHTCSFSAKSRIELVMTMHLSSLSVTPFFAPCGTVAFFLRASDFYKIVILLKKVNALKSVFFF